MQKRTFSNPKHPRSRKRLRRRPSPLVARAELSVLPSAATAVGVWGAQWRKCPPSRPSGNLNAGGHRGGRRGTTPPTSSVYDGRRGAPPPSTARVGERVTRKSKFPPVGVAGEGGRQKVSPSTAMTGITNCSAKGDEQSGRKHHRRLESTPSKK